MAACHEKWLRLSTEAPGAGDPAVHPGQPAGVVAGLVVRVRPGVRGVAGAGLGVEGQAGQLHRLVEPALLLAHEREQPGEPPVVAVRGGAALDDLPRVLRHGRHAGEGDGRDRDREQQGVRRVPAQVRDERPGVALDVPGDRLDVAALAVRAAPGVQAGVAQPGLDVDGGAQLVAEERHRGMAEGEGRVEGDGGGDGVQRPLLEPQQVADAAVVRRDGVGPARQRQPVPVHTTHVRTLSH